MKKSILMITLVLVFGLLCNTSLWAGNGSGMRDGSMLEIDLNDTTEIAGDVSAAGIAGSGLNVVDAAGNTTTVYGMGSLSYWGSLGVEKPAVGEYVEIDAVEVTFTDGSTRWIAVSLTVDDTFVTLRTADGPAWRGNNKQSGAGGGQQAKGKGTGTCLQVEE